MRDTYNDSPLTLLQGDCKTEYPSCANIVDSNVLVLRDNFSSVLEIVVSFLI